MARFFINLFIASSLLMMIPMETLRAQTVEQKELIVRWERLASRADEVLERSQASNDNLKIILSDLLKQRKEVYQELVASELDISQLSEELEALGSPPTESANENKTIAKRRSDLNNLIQAANIPFVISSGMLKRTDFLIEETNTILRDRLTQKLFSYGASPLDTTLWLPAIYDLTSFFSRMLRETMGIVKSETQWTLFLQKIPIIIVLLLVAILVFILFFKRVFSSTFNIITDTEIMSVAPIIRALLSSLSYGMLLLSAFFIIQAFKFSGLLGFNGIAVANSLVPIALTLVCANWLSENLCFDRLRLRQAGILYINDNVKSSRLVKSLGFIFATTILVERLAIAGSWSVATQSVINFPLLFFASFFLFQLFGLFSQSSLKLLESKKESFDQIHFQVPAQLQTFLRLLVVVAPILAAAGYLYAAQKIIYPIILTLALVSVSSIAFALLKSIFDSISEPVEDTDDGFVRSRWALAPVLLVVALGCINIPIIALIWGAQVSDIYEIWLRLNEGIPLGSARVTLPGLISLVVIFCLGFGLTRFMQRILRKTVLPKTSLDSGGRNALVSGVGYSGIILSTMIAISSTGLDLSSLAIVAGALSVGLGFGLQTIVSNFVSGVILLIERPIKEGDWIEVAGFSGTVRKISVRSTQIQTFDRGTVIVPNSELISGSVLNYTHSNSMGRVRVPVGVAYGTDPRRVESILLGIAEGHPQVLKDPGPSVVFMGFGPDSIDFEIRAFMKDVGYVLAIKSEMNYEIMEAFNKEGVEIPFAQRDIYIKNLDSLNNVGGEDLKTKAKE